MVGRLMSAVVFDALGDADVSAALVSAPAILSLLSLEPSFPPPHAVTSRAALAASAVATGKVRRFTVDSP